MLAVSSCLDEYGGNQIVVRSEQDLCAELTTAEAGVNPPGRLEFSNLATLR